MRRPTARAPVPTFCGKVCALQHAYTVKTSIRLCPAISSSAAMRALLNGYSNALQTTNIARASSSPVWNNDVTFRLHALPDDLKLQFSVRGDAPFKASGVRLNVFLDIVRVGCEPGPLAVQTPPSTNCAGGGRICSLAHVAFVALSTAR